MVTSLTNHFSDVSEENVYKLVNYSIPEKKTLKNTNSSCFIVTNRHVFVNSTDLTNVFGMFSSQLSIGG